MGRRILAIVLVLIAAAAGAQTRSGGLIRIQGPTLIGTSYPSPEFISFETSTTFGVGGSIYDYSNRFAIPKEIGLPPTPASYANQNTTLKDGGCSSDGTTQNAIKELLDGDGSGDVADDTAIWLPDDCKVKWFMDPTRNQSLELNISGGGTKYDDIMLVCEDPDLCGLDLRYRAWTGGSPADWNKWDWTAGDAYSNDGSEPLQAVAITVGNAVATSLQSCNWTGGYSLGAKKLETDCTISLSGASAWGPGDIVRLSINDIAGFGTLGSTYLTRVTCVRDNSGTLDPAVDPGGLCDEITGNNQIQIEDPLPMGYGPNDYFWGVNSGTSFDQYPSGSGTYADTSGHQVHQIERAGTSRCDLVGTGVCGNGTGTDQIVEGFVFYKMGWSIFPEYIGGTYIHIRGAFGTHIYGNEFDGRVGGNSMITVATSATEAGRTSIHSNLFDGGPFNSICFGEINAIRQTNPIEIDVLAEGCSFSSADDWVGFTSDVTDTDLAGNLFKKTPGTLVTGTPDIQTVTLDGVDGTCGTGICVDTTPGGLMVHMDNYAMAGIYMKGASNTQIVNNRLPNTTQTMIMQSGSMQTTFAYNYKRATADFRNGRGPFAHGNSYGSGNLMVMNDMDQAFVPLEESNRAPTDNGEGVNHLWYKNRCVQSTATTAPIGTSTFFDYSTRGDCFEVVYDDQWGAVNEDWNILLNVGEHVISGNTAIDEPSNNPDTNNADNTTPHLVYELAYHRNRSGTGIDQDDNFNGSNATTVRDNSGTDQDESDSVPAGWSAEIGLEPTSIWPKPAWWDTCTPSAMTFGQMGAYYDNLTGALSKLPAQIIAEGGTCTGLP